MIQNVDCDVFEDRDGHAYDAYRSAKGINEIVIIRPDGVIGAIVRDIDWLERYFTTNFCRFPLNLTSASMMDTQRSTPRPC